MRLFHMKFKSVHSMRHLSLFLSPTINMDINLNPLLNAKNSRLLLKHGRLLLFLHQNQNLNLIPVPRLDRPPHHSPIMKVFLKFYYIFFFICIVIRLSCRIECSKARTCSPPIKPWKIYRSTFWSFKTRVTFKEKLVYPLQLLNEWIISRFLFLSFFFFHFFWLNVSLFW